VRIQAERALLRLETPPGQQSQIDWGQASVRFRDGRRVPHIFVLTLGFSRRSFYRAYPDERMPEFLDAHEEAFEYFGGRPCEHLSDRPRTVCHGTRDGKRIWNPTFKAFADYWGFEPRVCKPYRAQTKGKVESGVKSFRRNFLPGRTFVDDLDCGEQLADWVTTIADVRVHGTTHERPCDRFAREQPHLIGTARHASFRLEARHQRIVATDYLVSVATNRYSVPFTLIGQPVEVLRRDGALVIFHRGVPVATHAELPGQHQVRILPEHGPGAIARISRQRRSTVATVAAGRDAPPDVEVRDPAVYETLVATRVAS
jgi:Mu transposase-like protein/integrase-like protein